MTLRPLAVGCLWSALTLGILAMPAAILISTEDGPMPADQVWRKKALAKTVLLMGGGVAALAACGLHGISRTARHRA